MAFCPNCNAKMASAAIRCDACGYDFPDSSKELTKRTGIAYSPLADLALFIGAAVAAIQCLAAVVGGIVSVISGRFVEAFLLAPIVFLLSLAMLVVFLRTADNGKHD